MDTGKNNSAAANEENKLYDNEKIESNPTIIENLALHFSKSHFFEV